MTKTKRTQTVDTQTEYGTIVIKETPVIDSFIL